MVLYCTLPTPSEAGTFFNNISYLFPVSLRGLTDISLLPTQERIY